MACESLPMRASHCIEAGGLPRHHDDPFDRMLIAQARLEQLLLMSADPVFARYEVPLFEPSERSA
jgi:PIN domain nuclease of toxin-antitoxin system